MHSHITYVLKELQIGSYLGEGGFCVVHSITGFQLGLPEETTPLEMNTDQKNEKKQEELRRSLAGSGGLYAIKRTRNDLSEEEEIKAVNDLAIEVTISWFPIINILSITNKFYDGFTAFFYHSIGFVLNEDKSRAHNFNAVSLLSTHRYPRASSIKQRPHFIYAKYILGIGAILIKIHRMKIFLLSLIYLEKR